MEPLLDPVGDRVMKDIVPPPHKPIADELLYPNKCKNDMRVVLKYQYSIHYTKLGTFEKSYVQRRQSFKRTLPKNSS
jgi:hypothetical protein